MTTTLKRLVHLALVTTAAVAAPTAALADPPTTVREVRSEVHQERERLTPRVQVNHDDADEMAAAEAPVPLRQAARVDNSFDMPLQSGCTYHATVHGVVRPVAYNGRQPGVVQRLRPDLRVAATVRCPGSTESHIQERRVISTGVTREELDHLLQLNASVARMQNSGRCMYVPEMAFTNNGVVARRVDYLCPSSRGGGPWYDRRHE